LLLHGSGAQTETELMDNMEHILENQEQVQLMKEQLSETISESSEEHIIHSSPEPESHQITLD
jgi:UDP-N-acetylglucosamine:LPS N-acetylglucosamine transferase